MAYRLVQLKVSSSAGSVHLELCAAVKVQEDQKEGGLAGAGGACEPSQFWWPGVVPIPSKRYLKGGTTGVSA